MKHLGLSLIAIALFASGNALAQTDSVRYNQYGVKVDREALRAEQRNNVLVFESANQDYRFWMDNRVQVDAATFFGKNHSDYDRIGNGAILRRVRSAVKAQVTPYWYGEIDLDFAGGTFELKDAYLEYSGLKAWTLKAGNFKEDFSMEETTSSRYLPFIERPMVVSCFAPSRHLGFQAEYATTHFRVSGGAFLQSIAGTEEATNVEDNNKDYGRSQGYSFTGKFGYMPYSQDRRMGLYLGADASYRTPKTDVATGDYGGERYNARNCTSINRKKYLDTDVIKDVNHSVIYGLEAAGYYGPLRIQGEYIGNHTTALANSYNFKGFYGYVGCLLFGGHQNFNTGEGEFTQPARGKKWGDIEVLARYDYLDLNNKDVYGGSGQNFTLGFNFYVNNAVKIAANYQYSRDDRYANGKGKLLVGHDATGKATSDYTKMVDDKGKAGIGYHMLALRLEIDF
jgi:phosphate-selective porin OprO/OprP